MITHFVQNKGNIKRIANEKLFQVKIYQSFVNHTDIPDNAIILLKTDFNSIICLLEINQVTCLKCFS